MTTSTVQTSGSYPVATAGVKPEWRTWRFWKENYEFILALITLAALLTGLGAGATGQV